MPIFALTYEYSADTELRMATRPAHRDYLQGHVDQGTLLLAGARGADEAPGALLITSATDRTVVETMVAGDPYVTGGIVTGWSIVVWEPALGTLTGALP